MHRPSSSLFSTVVPLFPGIVPGYHLIEVFIMTRSNRIIAVALLLAAVSLFISVGVPGSDAATEVQQGDLKFTLNPDGTAVVEEYTGQGGDVTIPSVIIDNGRLYIVTSVGYGAFEHSPITSVVIPDSVKTLDSFSFFDCDKLVSVDLGEGLEEIGFNAFRSCDDLITIFIPASVTTIGTSAFGGADLESVMVSHSNMYFKSMDGVLFSKDGTRLLAYPGEKSDFTYEVPSEVREIDRFAFYSKSTLKEIYFNEGLTMLSCPLDNCVVDTIHLPSTLIEIRRGLVDGKVGTIILSEGNRDFVLVGGILYDSSMETVIEVTADAGINILIPEGVTDIGEYSADSLSYESFSLPSTLETIGNNSFQFTRIYDITIPGSVETIGDSVFWYSYLEDVTFMGVPESLGQSSFYVRSATLTEHYADSPIPLEDYVKSGTTVEYIPLGSGHVDVPSIEIDGLTYELHSDGTAKLIGFEGEEIIIPEKVTYEGCGYTVTSMRDRMFDSSSIAAVSIPGTIAEIGAYAFWHCDLIGSLELGEGIERIGANAFGFCNALTSVTLPSTLEWIGEQPFYGCAYLKSISISSSNQNFKTIDDVLFSKDGTILYCYPGGKTASEYTVPDTVVRVGNDAFSFNDCLTSLRMNEGLESIGSHSIVYCPNLVYVGVPSTLEDLGDPFIRFCPSIMIIDVSDSNPWYVDVDGVMFTKDMTALLKYPAGSIATHYDVPEGVMMLASSSMDYACLESITLPFTLKVIGDYCFQYSMLESIMIPSSVVMIGTGAFTSSYLQTVIFEDVPSIIGEDAFRVEPKTIFEYYCVEKVPLEDYAKGKTIVYDSYSPEEDILGDVFQVDDIQYEVMKNLFYYAEATDYLGDGGPLIIPDSVEYKGHSLQVLSIGAGAFSSSDITELTLPSHLVRIERYAFGHCESLGGTLVIPDSVEYIGSCAFMNMKCSNVIIGKGLKSIEEDSFEQWGDFTDYRNNSGFLVDPDNEYFASTTSLYTPGLLTSKDGTILYSALRSMQGQLIIPDTVEVIAPHAFEFCSGFTGVLNIPASVREIGDCALFELGVSYYKVDPGNRWFKDSDGILMSKDETQLISCPDKYGRDVIIPDGTVTICSNAISRNDTVSGTVILPSSVRVVEDYAFYRSFFSSFILNDGLEEIGYYAFASGWLPEQGTLIVPSSVRHIDTYAFGRMGITDLIFMGAPEMEDRAVMHNPLETVTFMEPIDGDLSEVICYCDRSGYRMVGTFSDPGFTDSFSLSDGIETPGMVVYFKWEKSECSVLFEFYDGSGIYRYVEMGVVMDSIPEIPDMEGFKPGFWSVDGRTEFDFSAPITEDITLHATYEPLDPTVSDVWVTIGVYDGGARVMVHCPGSTVPEGRMTITFTAVAERVILGMKVPAPVSIILHDDDDGGEIVSMWEYPFENIPGDFLQIMGFSATFNEVSSGYMSCKYIRR